MRFVNKHVSNLKPQKRNVPVVSSVDENKVEKKKDTVMNGTDKIGMAEAVLNDTPKAVKKVKKDKGLIERTESSKTILTEDNKQVLFD